ncbi:MAG: HAD-IA family hydrolase [Acidimicrobiales bacterium]
MTAPSGSTAEPPTTPGDGRAGLRAVLFDFGGVMTSSPFDAFAGYEAANGLPAGFLRGLNANDHHANAWARLERGELSITEFATVFESEALSAGHEVDGRAILSLVGGELRPAMVEVARHCHERFLTAVATNNFPAAGNAATLNSRFASVLELFDEVVESSRIGLRKPEPAFYLACCEQLAIRPQEAVFIDDLGVNLKPARQLGMTTIKFVTEAQAISDLEKTLGIPLR